MNDNPTQREQMMAALSAAEHLVANTPEVPCDLNVQPAFVDVFFYRKPEHVVVFAHRFGLELSLREQFNGNNKPIIEARGTAPGGVPVRGWSLGIPGEMDQYRAVLADALVGLPAAWSAAVSA